MQVCVLQGAVFIAHNNQKSLRCAEKVTIFADEIRESYWETEYGCIVKLFYNDDVVQASKIAIFLYRPAFYAPQLEGPCRNITITFGVKKLE